MSRSTRLATTAHIMVYLAFHEGSRVRIDDVAKSIQANPSRLRQLCGLLSQAGFIRTYKGARGGIRAVFSPADVSLLDLSRCLEEMNFFSLSPHQTNKKCPIGSTIHPVISKLYQGFNEAFQQQLKATTIQDLVELAQSEARGQGRPSVLAETRQFETLLHVANA